MSHSSAEYFSRLHTGALSAGRSLPRSLSAAPAGTDVGARGRPSWTRQAPLGKGAGGGQGGCASHRPRESLSESIWIIGR